MIFFFIYAITCEHKTNKLHFKFTRFFISIQKQLKTFVPITVMWPIYCAWHHVLTANGCHNALWLLLYKKLNTLQAAWRLCRVKLWHVKYVRGTNISTAKKQKQKKHHILNNYKQRISTQEKKYCQSKSNLK